MDLKVPHFYLASRSPRRAALLKQMGFSFKVIPADVDEEDVNSIDPAGHVLELSRRKAEAVLNRIQSGMVVGADTIVHLEGNILGKPGDAESSKKMLSKLSGKTHEVYTGFSICEKDGKTLSDFERTDVTFRKLQKWEIEAYSASGHPFDKAGGYGIQDQSGLFVERIDGCFYNVVGFPLTKFYEALKQIWDTETLQAILRK